MTETQESPFDADDPLEVLRSAFGGTEATDTAAGDAPPAAPAATAPPRVAVELDAVAKVQFAMHVNQFPTLRAVRLENLSDGELSDLSITVRAEPPFAAELVLRLAQLRPGGVKSLTPTWHLDAGFLDRLTERTEGRIVAEVRRGEELLGTAAVDVSVFTRAEWPGARVYPELVAAFVMPNDDAVAELTRAAGEKLREWTGSSSLDGYQQADPAAALRQAAAVYAALADLAPQYVSPPPSFEREGQRVRLPRQIVESGQAACLDLALFAVAGLEAAGLHALVIFVEGHAFCGAFLHDWTWPDPVMDDVARLRNHLALGEIVVFEPTAAVAGERSHFDIARAKAERHLRDDGAFRFAVDVRRARLGGVRPMSTLRAADLEGADASRPPLDPRVMAAPTAHLPHEHVETNSTRASTQRPEPAPARIEAWKQRLLDLTLRNRLLNLPARANVVRFLVADVAALEDSLANGARFRLAPRPAETTLAAAEGDAQKDPRRVEESLRALLVDAQAKRVLHAELDEEALTKRLTTLRREAKTGEEEGGASNLYVAVGLLKYFETERSQQARLAPILLVPAKLVQRTARAGVELEARPEEARINVTLLRYLEAVHRVHVRGLDPLPDDSGSVDVPRVFRSFREEIAAKRGWEVLEEARLGMFSFSKILIWRDLEQFAGRLLESRVVRHLVETPGERYDDGLSFRSPAELDRCTTSQGTYVPLSADSSQLAAILAAAEGKSFVLIGPPGTGKSQTITNLITHCLATGKKVLFVSEKMAALEVVHGRLVQVGLEDMCLELHSGKANKKAVLQQLERSLGSASVASGGNRDVLAAELDEVRDGLNAYVDAMHMPRASGESVFGVTARLVALGDGPVVELGWTDVADTGADTLARARRAVAGAEAAAREAGVAPSHPLDGVGHREYSALWQERSAAVLSASLARLEQYAATAELVRESFVGPHALPIGSDASAVVALMALLRGASSAVTPRVLCSEDWGVDREAADAALSVVERLRSERAHFGARYGRAVTEIDPTRLLAELTAARARWFLPRFLAVRAWRKRFFATTDPKEAVDVTTAEVDLERIERFQAHLLDLQRRTADVRALLGEAWQGERTDLSELRRGLEWIQAVRQAATAFAARTGAPSSELLQRWSQFLPGSGGVPDVTARAWAAFPAEHRAAMAAAGEVEASVAPLESRPWRALEATRCVELVRRWLSAWTRERLRPWCRWQVERSGALEARVGALVNVLEDGTIPLDELVATFERSFGVEWHKHTTSADPALRDFASESHERSIARFRELDDDLAHATRAAVRGRIAANRASLAPWLQGKQGSFLRRELQKQRAHKPIRTLFVEAGDLVRELRPCLLMSPLSVAQFLDPRLPRFDVVVFDEASQMPVWDAIGAAARGEQLIVVGDPKQLPPTNFFGKTIDEAEGASETEAGTLDVVADLESVLDECRASNIEEHTLTWHYRSRHESLIAFSNHNYYDGNLITFPAARSEGVGVTWRPVPDGVYDFGKSRTNRREAEEVVAEIVRRLQDPVLSQRSIGVVTFSQAQQTLVEDLLDEARRAHPGLEPYFDAGAREPVFVKNLENVQGDERDVILLTVCYGPDHTGRVHMHFGPLNREGGWRRLNVAISRARREMVVFSTLRADQIDLDRSRAAAVRDLRRFLEYVQRGEAALATELSTDLGAGHDSPLEAEVCAALEGLGWTVHRQVGCSGYRIDLAVVDPEQPECYLLGIECDGSNYRSAPTARDRDKLRHELLEGLGWTLHRVWSSDWYEDRARELEALGSALGAASERARVREAATATRSTAAGTVDDAVDDAASQITLLDGGEAAEEDGLDESESLAPDGQASDGPM
jgi:very-short-patch-repair endonuclease